MDLDELEILTVVWYDRKKGYGFTRSHSEGIDVFIHKGCLLDFGLERLEKDDEIVATVSRNDLGLLVKEIRQITRPEPTFEAQSTSSCDAGEFVCTLKFYNPNKGYGFAESVTPHELEDVFIHASCLNNAGIRLIDPGQRLVIRPRQTERGLVADRIRLLTSN